MSDSVDSGPCPATAKSAPGSLAGARTVLRLPEGPLVLPAECACCDRVATGQLLANDRAGHSLLVGYCANCLQHIARSNTQRLAALLASALLAASLAFGLPILAPNLSLGACAACTLFGGLFPLISLRFQQRARAGHAARTAAVFFRAPLELVCESRRFAEALAKSTSALIEPASRTRFRLGLELAPVLAFALVGAPWSFAHQHPRLRVLNANDRTIEVWVDGQSIGQIEPSGSESPTAGIQLRVPAGRRELRTIDSGSGILARGLVEAVPGREHLYAPGAPTTCFWVERTAYGRAGAHFERVPLTGATRFWVVPNDVQGWFIPNPPADAKARTSGGTTAVLRQGSCDSEPIAR